ncbi:OLC1v1022776C1 [Oldenlandia corymbosa var. corymbosa]|uniref:OLC1v1022776C1 n=1 Tax=Oldenlandia corymbosa var. corymbosa TaxID=529605 RepID=A0AAV1C055_OLDCO|nr:OLC1v1022776C1 [Oldenlandia corymbosa var. corymbosa]
MSTSVKSSSKPTKPSNQSSTQTTPSRSSSSSLTSHLAMIELKQRILTSLSKLSDRDTHQIAVEDLEKIIQTLSNDGVPMLLNCLYDATNDPKPAVKKESLRLLGVLCASHTDSAATHLTKIIAHIVKRLKDSDTAVRDACRDAIGSLSSLYLKGEGVDQNVALNSVVGLFAKPLFEAMSENNKTVQGGAGMCMAKMVECASDPPVMSFQKLCSRIGKYLNSPNFIAKASLLPVVSSLSQVGAIAPQSLDSLLQSIHECLSSSDWATRKAAGDTLVVLALHSSTLVAERTNATLAVLEACRFDKIKPVRDSITEALQLWKKIAGKGDGASDDQKNSANDGETTETAELSEKYQRNTGEKRSESKLKDSSNGSSSDDPHLKASGNDIMDKAVGILRKKAPTLTDKGLNPEFFQKLETRSSDDLPVEVVVPRRCFNSSTSQNEEGIDSRERIRPSCQPDDGSAEFRYRNTEKSTSGYNFRERDTDDMSELNQRDSYGGFPKNVGQSESFANNKGNWLGIQRQLLQLERQQTHLMNMLQDFMGGSHDSMVTLENRVRGLERVVEDMARDFSITGRRGTNFMTGFDGSTNRSAGKYNGFSDYSSAKLGSCGDGRIPFERFAPSDIRPSGTRGKGPSWRSDAHETWDFQTYGRNGQTNSRRTFGGGPVDTRSPKSENDADQVGSRRAWDRGAGPVRFGEGPSARSVWQASKDEATLEAIRVAGEDAGASRSARVAVPEMTAEALGDDGMVQERDPVWNSWMNAMDALHVGDTDSAFAEVLSTRDDVLLVKLMDRTGPVIDQLSSDVTIEVLHVISQFLLEQNLFDLCLSWVQQLVEIIVENGPDVFGIPMDVKREILLNLHEASSVIELPEDWEGATPDQLMFQLASAWEIDLKQLEK